MHGSLMRAPPPSTSLYLSPKLPLRVQSGRPGMGGEDTRLQVPRQPAIPAPARSHRPAKGVLSSSPKPSLCPNCSPSVCRSPLPVSLLLRLWRERGDTQGPSSAGSPTFLDRRPRPPPSPTRRPHKHHHPAALAPPHTKQHHTRGSGRRSNSSLTQTTTSPPGSLSRRQQRWASHSPKSSRACSARRR